MNLANNVIRQVNKERTALEAWKKLDELYLVKSLSRKISLKVQLFGFKMDASRSLKSNFDELKKITIKLADSGKDLTNEN